MALPDGKELETNLATAWQRDGADGSGSGLPEPRESGIAPRGWSSRGMTDHPAAPARTSMAHSILPEPGEIEAVDEAWGDEDDEPTRPPSEPDTLRLSEALEFDIPKAARVPAMMFPPADVAPPELELEPAPPSGPPTLRITTRPPSTPQSCPSTAPGYGYRASQRPDLAGEMKSRFADGDFSGALVFAEAVLAADQGHEDANLYASSCRVGLAEAYLAELGDRTTVPQVFMSRAQLLALDLDPAHGFVVSQVDGMATVDEIIDVCGKPEHETLRILHDLFRRDVVGTKR